MSVYLQYTPEEIEWYGLTWYEALSKVAKQKEAANRPIPLKNVYRKNLVEKLKAAGIEASKTPDELSYVFYYSHKFISTIINAKVSYTLKLLNHVFTLKLLNQF